MEYTIVIHYSDVSENTETVKTQDSQNKATFNDICTRYRLVFRVNEQGGLEIRNAKLIWNDVTKNSFHFVTELTRNVENPLLEKVTVDKKVNEIVENRFVLNSFSTYLEWIRENILNIF